MSTTDDATDGGRGLPTADAFAIGDKVRDREDDDANTATVINLPPVSCADWEVGSGSVAEDNPEYDADADVVVVAFDTDLAEHARDWAGEEPLSLAEAPVRFYAFPPGRLAAVEETTETTTADTEDGDQAETPTDTDDDPLDGHDDVRALRDRLSERSEVRVEGEAGEPVLVVDKLGAAHRIRADGRVSEGPIADRLREVAAEYLGGEGE